MKVVLNVRDLEAGGAERAAMLIASGLHYLGHAAIIAVCHRSENDKKDAWGTFNIVNLKVGKPIKEARALATLVNDIEADAVVAFGINPGIGAALSQRRWRVNCPLLIRNENNLEEEWRQASTLNRVIGPLLSRWAARHAYVVAVSSALARPTAEYLKIPCSQLTTILNPVFDLAPFTSAERDSLHPWLRDQTKPTLVAIGRLEHQKGFDVLIDAFSHARLASRARLVIFGRGSLHDALQAHIRALGLGDAVDLAGYTNDPIAQLRAAHAFVLSSKFEGFGLVLVEALWAGTHVIATDCNYGPREVLEDGRYGILVPVEDAHALARAILASLEQPRTTPRPPDEWFQQYSAIEAARQHVALIESVS